METFGTGIAFLIVGIVSLVLNTLNVDFIGLRYWGYWLFIPAFFIMIGGFSQISINNKFKKAVRAAILDRGEGTYKLEDLALEVGIKPKDVLRVLVDLRAAGMIKYKFNSETGEIILGEGVVYKPAEGFVAPPKKLPDPLPSKGNYCAYCGNELSPDAKYCAFCGSKVSD
jgi:hypothetical protein